MPASSAAAAAEKKTLSEQERLEASVQRERNIGDKVAEEIAKAMEFVEDPVVTARVRSIFNRLTPWVTRPLPYSIRVVKEKSPNAFCIPGGYIYVTTGLIHFVKSDAELAYVIAHELAHADGKHVIIQMERNKKLSLAALAIAIASKGEGAAVVLSSVASMAISNSYSRDLEREADLNALQIADHAGYSLMAAVTVMERLAAEELRQPWVEPGIALDHPKISERIDYIADYVKDKKGSVRRKEVLRLLRPRVTEENRQLVLSVDSVEVMRGAVSQPGLREYMESAASEIQRSFQMETSPYDIRVVQRQGEGPALYIGISKIMSSPVPGGNLDFDAVREKLVEALTAARRLHPLADYNG
ncbi:MAG: M48 family metalloprotease [Pyramidobacter sp.]|nr:M48 family metalloprotease [Pyramidobacter sp.]